MRFFKRKLMPISLKYDVGSSTSPGKVRTLNEDSIICVDLPMVDVSGRVCAIADGLGGYEGGEIASKTALDEFIKSLTDFIGTWTKDEKEFVSNSDLTTNILVIAVQTANAKIYNLAQSQDKRMATTIAASLIMDDKAYIVNVGDSRVYLLDGDTLSQITSDHSLVAGFVASGTITPEEVYTHPQRNMVTRCLGIEEIVEADTFIENLKPGDALLICSDGLWEMIRNDRIKEILIQAEGAQAACDRLIEEANLNGGTDNISVIIVKNSRISNF